MSLQRTSRAIASGLTAAALAVLPACAPTPPTNALTKDDPFRPFKAVETDVFRFGTNPGVLAVRLVAEIDRKTGATETRLKVHHQYIGKHRHNYESARNIRAELLRFTVVARYGNCHVRTDCPLDELYIVDIPEADLRAAAAKGYPVKVFPRVGPDIVITVPPEMIASLTRLVDQERAGAGTSARKS